MADLKVLSVGTVGSALRELISNFELQLRNRVQIEFGNPAAIIDQLRCGKSADIAIQGFLRFLESPDAQRVLKAKGIS